MRVDFAFKIGERVKLIALEPSFDGVVTGAMCTAGDTHQFQVVYWAAGARHAEWFYGLELKGVP